MMSRCWRLCLSIVLFIMGTKWLRINGLTGASARGSWVKESLWLLDLRLRLYRAVYAYH